MAEELTSFFQLFQHKDRLWRWKVLIGAAKDISSHRGPFLPLFFQGLQDLFIIKLSETGLLKQQMYTFSKKKIDLLLDCRLLTLSFWFNFKFFGLFDNVRLPGDYQQALNILKECRHSPTQFFYFFILKLNLTVRGKQNGNTSPNYFNYIPSLLLKWQGMYGAFALYFIAVCMGHRNMHHKSALSTFFFRDKLMRMISVSLKEVVNPSSANGIFLKSHHPIPPLGPHGKTTQVWWH